MLFTYEIRCRITPEDDPKTFCGILESTNFETAAAALIKKYQYRDIISDISISRFFPSALELSPLLYDHLLDTGDLTSINSITTCAELPDDDIATVYINPARI